jgi:hypothetical protein
MPIVSPLVKFCPINGCVEKTTKKILDCITTIILDIAYIIVLTDNEMSRLKTESLFQFIISDIIILRNK